MSPIFHANYHQSIHFANGSSANIKILKTELGQLPVLLLKTGLPLTTNVLKPLAKSVLVPLGLTATTSATEVAIQKKKFGSAMHPSNLAKPITIISNKEMDDIMKLVKSLKYTSLLIKGVSKTIQNEAKKQKGGFLSILLGTLGASLLGNLLAG